jgi:hypothetical protein
MEKLFSFARNNSTEIDSNYEDFNEKNKKLVFTSNEIIVNDTLIDDIYNIKIAGSIYLTRIVEKFEEVEEQCSNNEYNRNNN